ncbi:MAG: YdcF family protein [Chitinophagaceae bacterium]|nr:YdcF family protein [Chitinophagaceae bacterium]
MFFILSKLLNFLISPFYWLIFFIAMAMLGKNVVRKKRFAIISICWLVFFTNPFIIHKLTLAWQQPRKVLAQNENYSSGIVLAGFISFNYKDNQGYYGQAADRFIQALRLYKLGHIKKIVITGGSGSIWKQQYKEADFVKEQFLELGIPAQDIIAENQSKNTFENAVNTKKILDSLKFPQPYLLITAALHMKRSLQAFSKAGMNCVPYPANFFALDNPPTFASVLMPAASAFTGWDLLLKEVIGLWVYKFTGKA